MSLRNAALLIGLLALQGTCIGQVSTGDPVDPDIPSALLPVPSSTWSGRHLKGLNAGITLTGVHNSATGWATVATTGLFYNFSSRFSADASVPLYLFRLAQMDAVTPSTTAPPGTTSGPGQIGAPQIAATALQPHRFDLGDVSLAFHTAFFGRRFTDVITPSITAPSGDSKTGLSTGRVTFDLSDHLERALPRSVGILDLGAGDSSNLVNTQVTRSYTSLGALAHFQLGLRIPLVHLTTFQVTAYEQLPLDDSKIYSTFRRPGYPDQTVVSGRGVSEDNGFTNALDIPLNSHLALGAYYNRSLRLHLDTVGMSLSFVARGWRRSNRTRGYFDELLTSK